MRIRHAVTTVLLFLALIAASPFPAAADTSKDLYMAVMMQDPLQVKSLLTKGANANYKENGRPVLAWAAQSGNDEIVSALLAAGADPNVADTSAGHTALMRAIDTQYESTVKILLKAKADPNKTSLDGKTCLDMAVESRKPGIVQALLDSGANVKAVSADGDSPVLLAAQNGMEESYEIIRILAKAGAPMDQSNAAYSPLEYAVEQENLKLIQVLLENGANPSAKVKTGSTPLHRALDNTEILTTLIGAKGVDLNVADETGDTPLISAARNGRVDAVKILLKAGADTSKKDLTGATALMAAEGMGQTEIVALLKPSGAGKESALPTSQPADPTAPWKGEAIAADFKTGDCTIVEAARKQMEIHELLQAQVNAGKMSSDIFRTFNDDLVDYGKLLTTDPGEACRLLERLRKKYGV